ncbi:MAG: zinc metallopeptidase [Crocinitomicaceae bacterium]|nr:zinc metallopeptidase [Crocinitomicaceae bacterium]
MSYLPLMIAGLVFMLIGWLVSSKLKRTFAKYSKIPSQRGLTGKEIAEQMLKHYGIYDVKVISVKGQLTDHYNPINKTVNLSESVYNQRNASAAAVAAHECGHAVQHDTAYRWLGIRSKLVPVQNISARVLQILMIALMFGGATLYAVFPVELVLWIMVAGYGAMALFAVVTLPVEFDASKRALAWIKDSGTATVGEYEMSKDALKWAAMTYVVAALAAITSLVLVLMQLLARRD